MNDVPDSTRQDSPRWQETESTVHVPDMWILLLVGLLFAAAGACFVLSPEPLAPDQSPDWLLVIFSLVFSLSGMTAFLVAGYKMCFPATVRHAERDQFPVLPHEPVLDPTNRVGACPELVEVNEEWRLQPARSFWRDGERLLCGFFCLFLCGVAGGGSWILRRDLAMEWPWAIFLAGSLTLAIGMTMLAVIGEVSHHLRQSFSTLTIPKDGDLLLECLDSDSNGVQGSGRSKRDSHSSNDRTSQLAIPRQDLMAVQLVPWKLRVKDSEGITIFPVVQGLLVLRSSPDSDICRVPILCTCDLIGGARVMRKLATRLQVPYFFDADRLGWAEEAVRSKSRPPFECSAPSGPSRSSRLPG